MKQNLNLFFNGCKNFNGQIIITSKDCNLIDNSACQSIKNTSQTMNLYRIILFKCLKSTTLEDFLEEKEWITELKIEVETFAVNGPGIIFCLFFKIN